MVSSTVFSWIDSLSMLVPRSSGCLYQDICGGLERVSFAAGSVPVFDQKEC